MRKAITSGSNRTAERPPLIRRVMFEENTLGKNLYKPKKVLKFRPINKNTEDIFINNNLFLGYVKNFNDPFEFSRSPHNITEYHIDTNHYVVYCVSEESTKHDILLWSHYADFHRGLCIEFTPDYQDEHSIWRKLEPVNYSEKPPKFEWNPHLEKALKEGNLDILNNYSGKFLETVLITKAKYWSYEKEWRIVLNKNSAIEVVERRADGAQIEIGRLYKFKPSELSRVIIGCKFNKSNEKLVANWISRLNNTAVKMERCIISTGEYNLKFKAISP